MQVYELYRGLINKMIRYVSEKEVEVEPPSPQTKTHSLQRSVQLIHPHPSSSEYNFTSSHALKDLKKINDQSQLIKGRLSYLQIHEQRNDFKAFLNEQRYQFHQHMRDQMERQRQNKALHLKKVLRKAQESQEQAKMERLQHEMNMKRANEQLHNLKASDYLQSKSKSKEIQQNLSASKREEMEKKKLRNYEIREYQKTQRDNVKEYLSNKKKELKSNDSVQSLKFSRLKDERQRQIEELSRLEAEMLQRQARSKMSSEQSQNRLKLLLGKNKKAVSTSHTTKLPYINNPQKRHTQQDMLVL